MKEIKDRHIAILAMCVSAFSATVAAAAFWQSRSQYEIDYDASLTVSSGVLPVRVIPSNSPIEIALRITNTSKSNIKYFVQAESNAACVTGDSARARLFPCMYESRNIVLSRQEASANSYMHKIILQAPIAADMPPNAYSSDPTLYLKLDIIDASNGLILFRSKCFYSFEAKSKSMVLYEPVFDSAKPLKSVQSECGL